MLLNGSPTKVDPLVLVGICLNMPTNDNTLPFGLTHQPSPSTLHRRPYTIIDATDMTPSLIANAEWHTVAASGSDPLER
jgi:hypothetical protein